MKGLNLFLAACFAVPMMDGAVADTLKNGRENAVQRTTTTTQNRTNTSTKRTNTTQSRTANQKNIIQRTTATINTITEKNRNSTPARDIVSRTAKKQTILTRNPGTKTTTARTATPINRTLSRAATDTKVKTRESVMQRDFGKCKTVFFDCMDEFCANKDAQLKRCACSTRANEFRNTQKSLDNVEDKLLDFSQRLLQINMDPADAAVINVESEGEKAYNETKDNTASKKALDEIAKKLNTSFESAENGGGMTALTWSLDADSAFDSVDSLSGVSTTAKSGTALRNVALPICRDMAAEVCDPDDISLVETSYNMAIEQDCNTVKKAYDTQVQNTRTKILESGALLDMTRLNNYQDRNSDDILTCKAKMLDMLTDTNVCGTDLTKCLDISGRYINPTTGEAFLSPDLVNLADLLVRPTDGDTWSKTPKNSSFVSYLNTKKKYIEPATKNCEDIADDVWSGFIDDALAKIKLAQNAKLEEVRQSCTKLLVECMDNAKTDLSEFDSRAMSTFGVMTDKTVNALCENIKTSCSAIMKYTPDDYVFDATNDANWDWETGTTQIAATETYNTIINTCREVGRDCIINSCKSITGNFGLCESINNSVNRHSILTRSACWDEVYDCVAKASAQSLTDIRDILPNASSVPQNLYEQMYKTKLDDSETAYRTAHNIAQGTPIEDLPAADQNGIQTARSVYDVCRERINNSIACGTGGDDPRTTECYICRITEQIWGNCKSKPDNRQTNAILIPDDINSTTLMSWFAKNTHTQTDTNSCATSICPPGSIDVLVGTQTQCKSPSAVLQCPSPAGNILCETRINVGSSIYNCCPTGDLDFNGNCCMNGMATSITEHLTGLATNAPFITTTQTNEHICSSGNSTSLTLVAKYTETRDSNIYTNYLFCPGTVTSNPNDQNDVRCSANYIILECNSSNKCYYKIPSAQTQTSQYGASYNYDANYFIGVNVGSTGATLLEDSNTITRYCPTDANIQNNKYEYNQITPDWPCASNSTCATDNPQSYNAGNIVRWLVNF